MQVCRLISFERIFPSEDTTRHDIDEIDQVDAENRNCGCDLASSDDREGREEKREHDRSRISHDHSPRYICASEKVCRRDDNREQREEEFRILFSCEGGIGDIEF